MLFKSDGYDSQTIVTAMKTMVHMHDIFRVRFKLLEKTQYIDATGSDHFYFLEEDISQKPQEYIQNLMLKLQLSIDIERGPLFALGLFHEDSGSHVYFVLHHSISDAYTFKLFLHDFKRCYYAAEKACSYKNSHSFSLKDAALLFESYTLSRRCDAAKAYWRSKLKTLNNSLPVDEHLAALERKERDASAMSWDLISKNGLKQLKKIVEGKPYTELEFYLTSIGGALAEWAQVDYMILKLCGHGRSDAVFGQLLKRALGPFWTTVPVIVESGERLDLETRISNVVAQHKNMPDDAGRSYELACLENVELVKSPEVLFNYYSKFHDDAVLEKGFGELSPYFVDLNRHKNAVSGYSLVINLRNCAGGLNIQICFNQREFSQAKITELYEIIVDEISRGLVHYQAAVAAHD